MRKTKTFLLFAFLLAFGSCVSKIKETNDKIYSRHLQKHIGLTIISTPVPQDKKNFNLLLLNDGQDMDKLRVKIIIDSLYSRNLIQPLVVVGIESFNRMQEYGVAGNPDYQQNGTAAEKYSNFVINELLPFVKKKSSVRKFKSITIAGISLGGLSAFDIAWDHADKIDKVGVLSGSFWVRDLDLADTNYTDEKNRIIINKIRSSRKRPHLKYWFYAGTAEETADRDKDGIIDVIDDTKDLMDLIKKKKVCPPQDVVYTEVNGGRHDYDSWSNIFPRFLIWAVGR